MWDSVLMTLGRWGSGLPASVTMTGDSEAEAALQLRSQLELGAEGPVVSDLTADLDWEERAVAQLR